MKIVMQFGVFLVIGILIASCRKEAFSPTINPNNQTMQSPEMKSLKMTAKPGSANQDYSQVRLEIKQVEIYTEDAGWITLNQQMQSFDALKLENGASVELLSEMPVSLEASAVSKVKLTYSENSFVMMNSPLGEIKIALNGNQSGSITIDIERTDKKIESDIMLVIDLELSLLQPLKDFVITPVIEFMEDSKTGITGSATGNTEALITIRNEQHTYHTYLTATGKFLVRNMEAGSYDIIIEPISEVRNTLSDMKISRVQVVEGRLTTIQQIQF